MNEHACVKKKKEGGASESQPGEGGGTNPVKGGGW